METMGSPEAGTVRACAALRGMLVAFLRQAIAFFRLKRVASIALFFHRCSSPFSAFLFPCMNDSSSQ